MPKKKTALPDGLEKIDLTEFKNGHLNFKCTLKKGASFKITIPNSPVGSPAKYHATTKNFMWLIRHAIDNNFSLRPVGNAWSFTEIAVCDGGVVDTKSLRLSFALRNSFVAPEYLATGKTAADLFFAQCGMSILQLNEKLEVEATNKRSIKASGASNGQSIAGATSTGTHGSAFRVGAVHDSIVGLHIVVGPARHVWLEKKSNPVASAEFIQWLGAEKISDDDMFNSAVVSFGSFGFIHGVLIETEPIYLLEEQRADDVTYDDALIKAMNNLDFTDLAIKLPYPPDGQDKQLYHFEILINPHQFEPNNKTKGVYLKTMYKIPYRADYPKRETDSNGFTYGENTLGVVQTIIDTLGSNLSDLLVPALVNKLFPLAFKASGDATGTIGETFNNTKFRGKAGSAAIGIDSKDTSRVLEIVAKVNKQMAFPGGLALRYVKGTSALLGFTRFEKTCILELDGVDSGLSRKFYQAVWDKLDQENIPYTLHWGKFNFNLTPEKIREMYGDAKVDKWIECRHSLLDEQTRKVFCNKIMGKWGLDV